MVKLAPLAIAFTMLTIPYPHHRSKDSLPTVSLMDMSESIAGSI